MEPALLSSESESESDSTRRPMTRIFEATFGTGSLAGAATGSAPKEGFRLLDASEHDGRNASQGLITAYGLDGVKARPLSMPTVTEAMRLLVGCIAG